MIGSATLHGLLLVVFLFGSAFLPNDKRPKDMGPVITIENAIVTDGRNTGGGNPNGNSAPPPPAPAPVQPKAPEPEPVKQEPVRVEPVKVKETPVKLVEKEKGELPVKTAKPVETKKEPTPTKSALTSKVIKKNDDAMVAQQRAAAERAAKEADRKRREEMARLNAERQRLADAVNSVVGGTGKSLTKGTVVEPLGPGGQAFVNYGSYVREIYERAWRVTPDLMEDDSSVVASVTIRRDGSVSRSSLSERSRNPSLNRSVQRALDSVTEIGKPFPAGAKEAERTFTIEFNLKTRKAIG